MIVSIRRATKRVVVTIDGSACGFDDAHAALQFLYGKIRETESAVHTAIEMWAIAEEERRLAESSNGGLDPHADREGEKT